MQWIRAHPYIGALCAAGILIVGGIFIVQRHGAAPVSGEAGTWSGTNLPVVNTPYRPGGDRGPRGDENILQNVQNNAPYTYIPPAIVHGTDQTKGGNDSFDLNSFIATISQGSQTKKGASSSGNSPPGAYAFIPSGLISTTTAQNSRTDAQQKLYEYGNEVGSYIQSYDERHANQTTVLKDQIEDRSNPAKVAALEALAHALQDVGKSLTTIENIPSGMASAHEAIAKSYVEIGANLALVPKAQTDADFIHAIGVYNSSADTFIKNYVTMAKLFGAYAVNFSPTDAGSVFTFAPGNF